MRRQGGGRGSHGRHRGPGGDAGPRDGLANGYSEGILHNQGSTSIPNWLDLIELTEACPQEPNGVVTRHAVYLRDPIIRLQEVGRVLVWRLTGEIAQGVVELVELECGLADGQDRPIGDDHGGSRLTEERAKRGVCPRDELGSRPHHQARAVYHSICLGRGKDARADNGSAVVAIQACQRHATVPDLDQVAGASDLAGIGRVGIVV